MFVHFTSDDSIERRGFGAVYSTSGHVFCRPASHRTTADFHEVSFAPTDAPTLDYALLTGHASEPFCSGTQNVNGSSGRIGDRSGPMAYRPNSDCKWIVESDCVC